MRGLTSTAAAFVAMLVAGGAFLSSIAANGGGLQVSLRFEHPEYITGEPIQGVLRIRNNSALPLIVDDYGDHLDNRVHFEIRRQKDETIDPLSRASVIERMMLMPGDAEAFRVNIGAFFPLAREGRYQARAKVVTRETTFLSSPAIFDVIPGLPILERSQVLPGSRGILRTYKLVYWPRDKTEQLFLRSYDEPGHRIWQTLRLGALLRTHPVQLEFAENNRIRIRRQVSRDIFVTTGIESTAQGLRIRERTQSEDFTTTPLRRMLKSEAEAAAETEATASE